MSSSASRASTEVKKYKFTVLQFRNQITVDICEGIINFCSVEIIDSQKCVEPCFRQIQTNSSTFVAFLRFLYTLVRSLNDLRRTIICWNFLPKSFSITGPILWALSITSPPTPQFSFSMTFFVFSKQFSFVPTGGSSMP